MAEKDLAKVCSQKLPRSLSCANTAKTANLEEFIRTRVFCAERGAVKALSGVSKPTGFTVAIPPDVSKEETSELSVILDVYLGRYLKEKRVINWTKEFERLFVLQTKGDGNCLLHAASGGIWGMSDQSLTLRRMLDIYLTNNNAVLRQRWLCERKRIDKQLPGGVIYSDETLNNEWSHVCQATRMDTRVQMGGYYQYEHLEEIHVFALANVLHRPIIIYGEPVIRNMQDSVVAENNFPGLYLPLLQNHDDCVQSPLLLVYQSSHFSPLICHVNKPTKTRAKIPLVNHKGSFLLVHCLTPDEERMRFEIVARYLELSEEYDAGLQKTLSYTWLQLRPIELKYNLMNDFIKIYRQVRQEALDVERRPKTPPIGLHIGPLRVISADVDDEMVLDLTEDEPRTEEEIQQRKIWRSAPGKIQLEIPQQYQMDSLCNGKSPCASTPPETKKQIPFANVSNNAFAASDFAIRLDKFPKGPPTEHYMTPSIRPKYALDSYPRDKNDLANQTILSKLPTTGYNPRPKSCLGSECTGTGETSTLGYCIACFLKGVRTNELTIPKIEEVREYEDTLAYENLTTTHGDWEVKPNKSVIALSKSYSSFDAKIRGKCRNPCFNCNNTGQKFFNYLCFDCYESLTKPRTNITHKTAAPAKVHVETRNTSTPNRHDALVQGLFETGLISPDRHVADIALSTVSPIAKLNRYADSPNVKATSGATSSFGIEEKTHLGREEKGNFLNEFRPIRPPPSPGRTKRDATGPQSPVRKVQRDSAKYTTHDYVETTASKAEATNKCKNTLCTNFGHTACDGYCNECFKRQMQIDKAEKNPTYVPMGFAANQPLQKCKNSMVTGCTNFGNTRNNNYCNECYRTSLHRQDEVDHSDEEEVYSFHSDHELEMMQRPRKH